MLAPRGAKFELKRNGIPIRLKACGSIRPDVVSRFPPDGASWVPRRGFSEVAGASEAERGAVQDQPFRVALEALDEDVS